MSSHNNVQAADLPDYSECTSGSGTDSCAATSACVSVSTVYSHCVPHSVLAAAQASLDSTQAAIDSTQGTIDMFYMIVNAQIVFFMQAGFAMLEVGIVNPKNAKSILFKNILDVMIVTIGWWLWGYGLAGGGASGVGGDTHNFLQDGGVLFKNSASFIHSLTFATTTTTIMSGGVAERMRVEVYMFISLILSSLVYSSLVSWCWSDTGFLREMGFLDFAGSCVVHLTGGTAALVGSLLVGPRRSR